MENWYNRIIKNAEAISVETDITVLRKREAIEHLITEDEFDYVGVIYLGTKTFELYNRNSSVRYPGLMERVPFADCVRYAGTHFIAESERFWFDQACDLDRVQAALEANDGYEASYLRTEDGTVTRKEVRYRWLDKEAGEILMMRTDVTAAYEQEQRQLGAIREALNQARRADAAKSEFLSRMSHDMRTPLNGIIGMTYLTEKLALPEAARENLQKIGSFAQFLLGLINDILDMTKAESGKIVLRPAVYTSSDFIEYIDAVIRPLCEEKHQELVTECSMPENVGAVIDKLRFNQIIFNLLSNAVKYSPAGSRILYRDVAELLPDGKIRDRIEVSDHGIGMSEAFQKVLFEPFTQENRIDTSEMTGSGLGLAITKKLVDIMGGSITVESAVGKGTTIRLAFEFPGAPLAGKTGCPAADGAGGTDNTDSAAVKTAAGEAGRTDGAFRNDGAAKTGGTRRAALRLEGMQILLCEDNHLNQEIAQALLREQGGIVTTAKDGVEGIDLFMQSAPGFFGCILMDIRMPRKNGYEAACAIRRLPRPDARTVPIIAMTADAFAEDIRRCLDIGMNGHIAKPVSPEIMLATILQAIGKK